MALLARIFSPRRTYKKEKPIDSHPNNSFKGTRPFNYPFDKSNVRILLFRECDWRGRKLLFDSTSVEKVPLDPNQPRPRNESSDMIVEVSSGYGYKYKKPHADINTLGEMIFGSIAMITRGSSIKVHSMKDPPRLMITKIIQAPRAGVRKRQISDEKTLDDSRGSSVNSFGECNSGSFGSKTGSFEATLDDSGFVSVHRGSDWSKHLSPPYQCSCSFCSRLPHNLTNDMEDTYHCNSSGSLHSGSSLSSLRRRWTRSIGNTLEPIDSTSQAPSAGKRTKLGVAVIIPLCPDNAKEMEEYLLDRLPLVNNIISRLQHSTERAYCRRDVFVQSMLKASNHVVQSVYELINGARLDQPVWLTLTSQNSDSVVKCDLEQKIVSNLSQLLATIDTKHTNFFVSTLLTAVLTHHLGWVPTVMPDISPHTESLFAELSRTHPYNPLWAQLTDLQGALGYPLKLAKTIVVGKSEELVHKLLSILSYFIRCGHVSVTELKREIPADEENHLEYLLENKQEMCSFDKEAIREFSTAGSFEKTPSTSTLTKSKTVLSMKTFSVKECEVDNANSLESGFESYHESSGGSYEEGLMTKPVQIVGHKLEKSKSSSNLMETSFSQNTITDLNFLPNGKINNSLSASPSYSSIVKCLDSNFNSSYKEESEKQYTSLNTLSSINKINSLTSTDNAKNKSSFFIKENLIQKDFNGVDKQSKVLFVLGENEELVNIKGQDKNNVLEELKPCLSTMKNNDFFNQPPVILINDTEVQEMKNNIEKTKFVAGDISNRVLIVHSTTIEVESPADSAMLKPLSRQRCLSVPEEAVLETDWVKRQRSKEIMQMVRRWLSDSAIERISHKPLSEFNSENNNSIFKQSCVTSDSVFRTSNESLKDTNIELNQSSENHVDETEFVVPSQLSESASTNYLKSEDEYLQLPSQSIISEDNVKSREMNVATSVFGCVGDSYRPELVLQGLVVEGIDWLTDLRNSLAVEAHSFDVDAEAGEAVCVLANTDTWEVSLVSSHCNKPESGVRVGMSQLVANLLETTQHLCSLSLPPSVCLSHVETKLQELCIRSQALAELLLTTDFLDMMTLTSALDLDANDVPLLLSIASTHSPLVTRKYGLSYQ